MLQGLHILNLDAKGRLAIPTEYREELSRQCDGRLTVTRHYQDRCLLLYPRPVWEEVQQRIIRLPSLDPITARLMDMMIGHADNRELDGAGRVLLKAELRNAVGLNKRIALVGQGRKFAIWNEELWCKRLENWEAQSIGGPMAADVESLTV